MDLKRYEGKNVLVQLRSREEWLVAFAPDTEDGEEEAPLPTPEVMLVNQGANGEGPPTPAAFPFINAKVIDDQGTLEIETGNGGIIHVQLSPEIIHSVSVVDTPAKQQRVQVANSGGIIHPPHR